MKGITLESKKESTARKKGKKVRKESKQENKN